MAPAAVSTTSGSVVDSTIKAMHLAKLWEMTVGHTTSFSIKVAVSLGIPDILIKSGNPMTLKEIAAELPGSNIRMGYLQRLMNNLVVKNIFSETLVMDGGSRYGLTSMSELLTKSEFAGLALVQNEIITCGWHHMDQAILHGGKSPFERAQGKPFYEYLQANPQSARVFSDAMVAMSNIAIEAILEHYKGFEEVKVVVDVGGGVGSDIGRIVAAYPHIRGINLELPHMVAVAPKIPGVEHLAGDMFQNIPWGDCIFLKAILHLDDEEAIKVLKNCYKALPDNGKVIIADIIMDATAKGPFDNLKFALDLVLLALTDGGLERTQAQWLKLLKASGFDRINIVSIPTCLQDVIEAYKSQTMIHHK